MDLPLDRNAEKSPGTTAAEWGLPQRKGFSAPQLTKRLACWIMAARPRTLALSITPVCIGTAVTRAMGVPIRWPAVAAALLGSMFIQIATNLHNDAADSEKGGDGPDRIGPMRVTSTGLLSLGAVKYAAAISFATAASIGLYLVALGGWPILLLGMASIGAGWAYTGGPRPIAYTPFGEVVVIAFFGLGAACGTYWLSAGAVSAAAAEAGLMLGTLTAAVLLVNNHRDTAEDYRVGRRTLAILAGPDATCAIYAAFLLSPFALLALLHTAIVRDLVWTPLLALPMALSLIHDFTKEPPGRGFNRILVRTVHLQILFSALLCIGLIA